MSFQPTKNPRWATVYTALIVVLLLVGLAIGLAVAILPDMKPDKPGLVALLCLGAAAVLGGRGQWRRPGWAFALVLLPATCAFHAAVHRDCARLSQRRHDGAGLVTRISGLKGPRCRVWKMRLSQPSSAF